MPNPALNVEIREDAMEVRMQLQLHRLPTFFEWFELWLEWLKELAARWYEALLRVRLAAELGASYGRGNSFETKSCPDCGAREAVRKGTRSRHIVVPRLGACTVARPYVACRGCGRSWAVFDEEMGLVSRRQYQPCALVRPLQALMKLSYAETARLYVESPSAMTLWRFVQEEQPSLREVRPEDGTCVMDATAIPGDGPRNQLAVGVAHVVDRGPLHYGRATLRRRVVAVTAGPEEKLRDALRDQDVDTLVHDGRLVMDEVARRPARCRWHVTWVVSQRTLREDRILGMQCRMMAAELARLVFTTKQPEHYASRIEEWLDAYGFARKAKTRKFLETAIPELLLPLRYPQAYTVVTTAPAEREMREINRRMENGAHWSVSGAKAFLTHHQIQRHEPKRYIEWIKSLGGPEAQKKKISRS